jgi:hypothetical protein
MTCLVLSSELTKKPWVLKMLVFKQCTLLKVPILGGLVQIY